MASEPLTPGQIREQKKLHIDLVGDSGGAGTPRTTPRHRRLTGQPRPGTVSVDLSEEPVSAEVGTRLEKSSPLPRNQASLRDVNDLAPIPQTPRKQSPRTKSRAADSDHAVVKPQEQLLASNEALEADVQLAVGAENPSALPPVTPRRPAAQPQNWTVGSKRRRPEPASHPSSGNGNGTPRGGRPAARSLKGDFAAAASSSAGAPLSPIPDASCGSPQQRASANLPDPDEEADERSPERKRPASAPAPPDAPNPEDDEEEEMKAAPAADGYFSEHHQNNAAEDQFYEKMLEDMAAEGRKAAEEAQAAVDRVAAEDFLAEVLDDINNNNRMEHEDGDQDPIEAAAELAGVRGVIPARNTQAWRDLRDKFSLAVAEIGHAQADMDRTPPERAEEHQHHQQRYTEGIWNLSTIIARERPPPPPPQEEEKRASPWRDEEQRQAILRGKQDPRPAPQAQGGEFQLPKGACKSIKFRAERANELSATRQALNQYNKIAIDLKARDDFASSTYNDHEKQELTDEDREVRVAIEALLAQHPNRLITISEGQVISTLKSINNGSSTGPDNTPPGLLLDAITGKPELIRAVGRLWEDTLNDRLPGDARTAVMSSRLFCIPKPQTGFRPINISNATYKAAATLLHNKLAYKLTKELHPVQHAVRAPAAADAARMVLQTLGNREGNIMVAVDVTQAFTSLKRSALLSAVHKLALKDDEFIVLLRAVYAVYKHDSPIVYYSTEGLKILYPKDGVYQGCPLSMPLFSLAIHPFLLKAQAALQPHGGGVSAYADDIGLAGPAEHVLRALAELVEDLRKIGLIVNAAKTHIACFSTDEQVQKEAVEAAKTIGVPESNYHTQYLKHLGSFIYLETPEVEGKVQDEANKIAAQQLKAAEQALTRRNGLSVILRLFLLRATDRMRMNHLFRGLPTKITEKAAKTWEQGIEKIALKICEVWSELVKNKKKLAWVIDLLRLPQTHGGFGLASPLVMLPLTRLGGICDMLRNGAYKRIKFSNDEFVDLVTKVHGMVHQNRKQLNKIIPTIEAAKERGTRAYFIVPEGGGPPEAMSARAQHLLSQLWHKSRQEWREKMACGLIKGETKAERQAKRLKWAWERILSEPYSARFFSLFGLCDNTAFVIIRLRLQMRQNVSAHRDLNQDCPGCHKPFDQIAPGGLDNENGEVFFHMLNCDVYVERNRRHNAVRDNAITHCSRISNELPKREPKWQNGNHNTRGDGLFTHINFQGKTIKTMADFKIFNPACKSNLVRVVPGKNRSPITHHENMKKKNYVKEINDNKDNCTFLPFIITIFGGFGPMAVEWARQLRYTARCNFPSIDPQEWNQQFIDSMITCVLETNVAMIYRGVIRGTSYFA